MAVLSEMRARAVAGTLGGPLSRAPLLLADDSSASGDSWSALGALSGSAATAAAGGAASAVIVHCLHAASALLTPANSVPAACSTSCRSCSSSRRACRALPWGGREGCASCASPSSEDEERSTCRRTAIRRRSARRCSRSSSASASSLASFMAGAGPQGAGGVAGQRRWTRVAACGAAVGSGRRLDELYRCVQVK